MNFFLKLKHWQLLGLLACTYLASQCAGTTTVILSQDTIEKISEHNYFGLKTTTIISSQEILNDVAESSALLPSQRFTVRVSRYSPLITLFVVVLLGWFFAVGVNLNKKLPDTVKMNLTKFKWFFFTPITLMFFYYVFVFFILYPSVSNGIAPNNGIFVVSIPLYLFSVFCCFYCIYFNAKSLKAVELQKTVTFRDYVAKFFLFWFFPIGIWFIQPKINKIFNETL
jgi:hypothetical protein